MLPCLSSTISYFRTPHFASRTQLAVSYGTDSLQSTLTGIPRRQPQLIPR